MKSAAFLSMLAVVTAAPMKVVPDLSSLENVQLPPTIPLLNGENDQHRRGIIPSLDVLTSSTKIINDSLKKTIGGDGDGLPLADTNGSLLSGNNGDDGENGEGSGDDNGGDDELTRRGRGNGSIIDGLTGGTNSAINDAAKATVGGDVKPIPESVDVSPLGQETEIFVPAKGLPVINTDGPLINGRSYRRSRLDGRGDLPVVGGLNLPGSDKLGPITSTTGSLLSGLPLGRD